MITSERLKGKSRSVYKVFKVILCVQTDICAYPDVVTGGVQASGECELDPDWTKRLSASSTPRRKAAGCERVRQSAGRR